MCSACLRAIESETCNGWDGKCIRIGCMERNVSCILKNLVAFLVVFSRRKTVASNKFNYFKWKYLNCCYFTYVHSIKIMSFWSTTDGDANNVGPPLPGPALRTSAGSSTNLHMLSTILGADLQENFLREITYFTKGISQHSQLKKRTLTGTRPSNMSPVVRSKAEASDPCWSAWLIWRSQRSPDVASVLRTSELQYHQVTASLGTASITSTFSEMCGHMHCDALYPRSAEAQHGGWKA